MRTELAFFVFGAAQGQLRHPREPHSRASLLQFFHSVKILGVDLSVCVVRWALVAFFDLTGPPLRVVHERRCPVAQPVCTIAPSQTSHLLIFFSFLLSVSIGGGSVYLFAPKNRQQRVFPVTGGAKIDHLGGQRSVYKWPFQSQLLVLIVHCI